MTGIFEPQGQYDKIAIMAPGPSLNREHIDLIMASGEYFTIAIGDAARLNPFADLMYHCDARWWNHYNGFPEFYGCQRISLEPTISKDVKQILKSDSRSGLDLRSPYVVTGGNSGYQALNLACHYKPKKIILIGYDMGRAPDGKYNIIGDHPPELNGKGNFNTFKQKFDTTIEPLAKQGITVYNCSLQSALTSFVRKDLKDVI